MIDSVDPNTTLPMIHFGVNGMLLRVLLHTHKGGSMSFVVVKMWTSISMKDTFLYFTYTYIVLPHLQTPIIC